MKKKILMIDDDPEFVDAISNVLDAKGYDVKSAPNGVKGLELAKEIGPDLILLDVMMTTKTEGFDVAREISESDELKGCPVIMITGVRNDMNLPFGFEPDSDWLPVREVLEKPIKPDVLLKAVETNIR
jgi:two-component system, OmpR family, alkaline phosphatase synthesis response regulator PhoP